jgi:homoserine O-acetyltransferase
MASTYSGPLPATGAWQEGDHPGQRKFVDLGSIELELGAALPNVRVAYETYGKLNSNSSNAIFIAHALTGDSHVAGLDMEGHLARGWWDGLIGPGLAIDTNQWFVVCANVLGGCQGTTGASSLITSGKRWGSKFPRITVADQVEIEKRLTDYLQIETWASIMGGSMGGMRVLEWAVEHPHRVGSGLVLASAPGSSADQIATQAAQIAAIKADPKWNGGDYYNAKDGEGPHVGLGIARRFAQLTYRSETELDVRFGRDHQDGEDPYSDGRFAIESYLDHHAEKLVRRFDANTYIALSDAMSTFDIGRNRGGVAAALEKITAPLIVAGIDTDRLFPLRQQAELVSALPLKTELDIIVSPFGHDGFLIEVDQVATVAKKALDLAAAKIK